jgi:hypothetical protein
MDNNLLETTIRVGSLEIIGIYRTKEEVFNEHEEAIKVYGIYDVCKIEIGILEAGAIWSCYKPLKAHIRKLELNVNENGNYEMYAVYGTCNLAGNVGADEVRAIINCLVDGVVIK